MYALSVTERSLRRRGRGLRVCSWLQKGEEKEKKEEEKKEEEEKEEGREEEWEKVGGLDENGEEVEEEESEEGEEELVAASRGTTSNGEGCKAGGGRLSHESGWTARFLISTPESLPSSLSEPPSLPPSLPSSVSSASPSPVGDTSESPAAMEAFLAVLGWEKAKGEEKDEKGEGKQGHRGEEGGIVDRPVGTTVPVFEAPMMDRIFEA